MDDLLITLESRRSMKPQTGSQRPKNAPSRTVAILYYPGASSLIAVYIKLQGIVICFFMAINIRPWKHRPWHLVEGMLQNNLDSHRSKYLQLSPYADIKSSQKLSADSLKKRFSGEGIKFREKDGIIMVELKLLSGTSANLMLPHGLITSFKPIMWHGGLEEMLYVKASRGVEVGSVPSIEGGVGLSFSYRDDHVGPMLPWPGQSWFVEDVVVNPLQYAKVTLACQDESGLVFIRYIITMSKVMLSSAIVVKNTGTSKIAFGGGITSHLSISEIEATYALGLSGCKYHVLDSDSSKQPRSGDFEKWGIFGGLAKFLSGRDEETPGGFGVFRSKPKDLSNNSLEDEDDNIWKTEKAEFTSLAGGMNRVYAMSTEPCVLLDRGKRRSTTFQKVGFSYLALSNPGPELNSYWDQFIRVGPCCGDATVSLDPGKEWRAAQIISNPNI